MKATYSFTMESACAVFLRNEINQMLAHADIPENSGIALVNLAEALDNGDRVIIDIVEEY